MMKLKQLIKAVVLLITVTISAQTQQFKKAIITDNEHIYNPVTNSKCRMIRVITPNRGVQFSDDTLDVYIQVFGLIQEEEKDADGNVVKEKILKEFPEFGNHSTYSSAKINAFFSAQNNAIRSSESFTDEFNQMLLNILLFDSSQRKLFAGDTFTVYTD